MTRQRLLYINAESTHPQSRALSAAIYEPDPDAVTQIDPALTELPYDSVHAAICDGWRVVQFPDQRAALDSDGADLAVLGYQFILEKLRDDPA